MKTNNTMPAFKQLEVLREMRSNHVCNTRSIKYDADAAKLPENQQEYADIGRKLEAAEQDQKRQILNSAPVARSLFDLQKVAGEDPKELLRRRFLCRGGLLLLTGPTGVGKSVFVVQALMAWALGKAVCGLVPTGLLRSLLIQSEDDDSDLAQMRDGVAHGLNLSAAQRREIAERVLVIHEMERSGPQFLASLEETIKAHSALDLVCVNPVLAFLGGSAAKQEEVGPFLRGGLVPLLNRYSIGGIAVHHVNKPKADNGLQATDAAYSGSGSIEWANVPRAILAMQPERGAHDRYKLVAAKRGGQLGWKDSKGQRVFHKAIGHSPDPWAPFWREVEDAPTGGRPVLHDKDNILELLPEDGLSFTDWYQKANKARGISKATFARRRADLESSGRITLCSTTERWHPVKRCA